MLCIGRPIEGLPYDNRKFTAEALKRQPVAKILRQRKTLALLFWKTWRRDYLLGTLAVNLSKEKDYDLRKGQIVLLREENLGKGKWKLAKVEEMKVGRDGKVRRVILRIHDNSPNSETRTTLVERHVNALGLLEGAPLISHQEADLKTSAGGKLI